jgi:hypothetical protein
MLSSVVPEGPRTSTDCTSTEYALTDDVFAYWQVLGIKSPIEIAVTLDADMSSVAFVRALNAISILC